MAVKFNKNAAHTSATLIGTVSRGRPYPLDETEIWLETDDENKPVLQRLEEYAAKNGQAYVGQKLTYITAAGDVTHYTIIDIDGTLRADAKFDYDEEALTLNIYV